MNSLITEIKSGALNPNDLTWEDLQLVDSHNKMSDPNQDWVDGVKRSMANAMDRLPSLKKKFLDDGSESSYLEFQKEVDSILELQRLLLMSGVAIAHGDGTS